MPKYQHHIKIPSDNVLESVETMLLLQHQYYDVVMASIDLMMTILDLHVLIHDDHVYA